MSSLQARHSEFTFIFILTPTCEVNSRLHRGPVAARQGIDAGFLPTATCLNVTRVRFCLSPLANMETRTSAPDKHGKNVLNLLCCTFYGPTRKRITPLSGVSVSAAVCCFIYATVYSKDGLCLEYTNYKTMIFTCVMYVPATCSLL